MQNGMYGPKPAGSSDPIMRGIYERTAPGRGGSITPRDPRYNPPTGAAPNVGGYQDALAALEPDQFSMFWRELDQQLASGAQLDSAAMRAFERVAGTADSVVGARLRPDMERFGNEMSQRGAPGAQSLSFRRRRGVGESARMTQRGYNAP